MTVILNLAAIRSLIATVETGGIEGASRRVGRSTSAVSVHLKKIQQQVGHQLLRKSGRRLVLTEEGERFLPYGRRMLDLNEEVLSLLGGRILEGRLRVGVQEDCAECILPRVLHRFGRLNPKVRVDVRIERNAALLEALDRGELDVIVAWQAEPCSGREELIVHLDVRWITSASKRSESNWTGEPLPLIVFDDPCWFRAVATSALDRANVDWRIAMTSPSLAGIWAGVAAGLGMTARTTLGLPNSARVAAQDHASLPILGSVALAVHRGHGAGSAEAMSFVEMLREEIGEMLPAPSIAFSGRENMSIFRS